MKRQVFGVVAACLCAVSLLFNGISASAEVIHETELEDYILKQMGNAHILGMNVAVVNAEKELYCAAFGQIQMTEADFCLASISQSITASAIMHMVDDEEIALGNTVGEYLPEYDAVSDITVEELLTHTSGILPQETMADLKRLGKRGEFHQANANYNLLGEIIEKISGESFEEYVSDNIFDPLEMTSTYSLKHADDFDGELVRGYEDYYGIPTIRHLTYDEKDKWMGSASGYMISDIKDMGLYMQMLLNNGGDVLSQSSVEKMLQTNIDAATDKVTNQYLTDGGAKYGMGMASKVIDGQLVYYNTGSVECFTSTMMILPEKGIGIVLLYNSSDPDVGNDLIRQLERGILAIEMGQKPASVEDTYYQVHGVIDGIAIGIVLLSWLPIFMMGFWCKRRRNNVFSIPGILIDFLIHVLVPVGIVIGALQLLPMDFVKRYWSDLYYIGIVTIASLAFGLLIKIIYMIVYAILGPEAEEDTAPEEKTEEKTEEKEDKVKREAKEQTNKPEESKS